MRMDEKITNEKCVKKEVFTEEELKLTRKKISSC
jgi:hypothetical protein